MANSRKYTRRLTPILAIATTATLVLALGERSRAAGTLTPRRSRRVRSHRGLFRGLGRR
jgi:hypothetical protein